MNRWNVGLQAKAMDGKDVVVLKAYLPGARIALLGSSASVPTSAKLNTWASSVFLAPEKEGVIAVKFEAEGFRKSLKVKTVFLVVSRRDDKPYVDFENPWLPFRDRMPRIDSDGIIEIDIGDVCFSSNVRAIGKPGKRYVDGNELCKYFVGDIDLEALAQAASEYEEGQSLKDELAQLEVEFKQKEEEIANVLSALDVEKESVLRWRNVACDLAIVNLSPRRGRRKKRKLAMDAYEACMSSC